MRSTTGRVHHAFLFTGTRGVGKTTIARIFAKSLNCERGPSAEPCGECDACRDIDAGRFVDLLEIDAASNTGVDDVREVIENAQYMPARGRFKVYLIDEVHMLSKHAFNALLKTLEEPPGHVKFLLATTDPQKLPVTVLSRCLQFNLKRLDAGADLRARSRTILRRRRHRPEPGRDPPAGARAADGSLRDGLSLLDQAIAYTGGQLDDAAVATMLGTVERAQVGRSARRAGRGRRRAPAARRSRRSREFSPDWNGVLDASPTALHRVQVRQLVPAAQAEDDGVDVDALAARLRRRNSCSSGTRWRSTAVATCRWRRVRAPVSRWRVAHAGVPARATKAPATGQREPGTGTAAVRGHGQARRRARSGRGTRTASRDAPLAQRRRTRRHPRTAAAAWRQRHPSTRPRARAACHAGSARPPPSTPDHLDRCRRAVRASPVRAKELADHAGFLGLRATASCACRCRPPTITCRCPAW